MGHSKWSTVHGSQYMVHSAWCTVHGTQHKKHDMQYNVHRALYKAKHSTWYTATQCTVREMFIDVTLSCCQELYVYNRYRHERRKYVIYCEEMNKKFYTKRCLNGEE